MERGELISPAVIVGIVVVIARLNHDLERAI
jgi:hypothetical protein